MKGNQNRKWKLEQLLYKQKLKQQKEYGLLFEDCVTGLGEGSIILSDEKSEETYSLLQGLYPFTSWSSIDWEKVNVNRVVANVLEIEDFLSKQFGKVNEEDVFILWSYGDFPVLRTQLHKFLSCVEEVLAVSSDVFILSPSKFVVEFHHEGKITIGYTRCDS